MAPSRRQNYSDREKKSDIKMSWGGGDTSMKVNKREIWG